MRSPPVFVKSERVRATRLSMQKQLADLEAAAVALELAGDAIRQARERLAANYVFLKTLDASLTEARQCA